MQGMHGSTFRGRGDDFEFFQPHALGEDTAHIDWKASERLEDGLLVRRLREERVLEVWIAADLSASMFTGFSAEGCKQRLLLDLIAIVGRSVIGQQDLLGFVGFDRNIRTVVQPFRSEKTFVNLLRTIWEHQPERGVATALLPTLRYFESQEGNSQQKKKRLLLLLSDFDTEDDWLPAAQRIHATAPVAAGRIGRKRAGASADLGRPADVPRRRERTVADGRRARLAAFAARGKTATGRKLLGGV